MKDEETDTLWSQLLGQAMDGKLKGKMLNSIPSTMTDWKSWKEEFPDTTVAKLSRTSKNYVTEFYKDKSKFVLGINQGRKAKAWSFVTLSKTPVVNDLFDGQPLVVVFDSHSKSALTFSRSLDGQVLEFKLKGKQLVDQVTGTTWNAKTGKAIKGKLAGKSLSPIPSIMSYAKAWVVFHPDTEGLTKEEIQQAKSGRPKRATRQQPKSKKQ